MPATRATPSSGRSSVESIRTIVVFPAPFGPSSPKTDPAVTVRSTWSTAVCSPNLFTRFSTWMAISSDPFCEFMGTSLRRPTDTRLTSG